LTQAPTSKTDAGICTNPQRRNASRTRTEEKEQEEKDERAGMLREFKAWHAVGGMCSGTRAMPRRVNMTSHDMHAYATSP